MKYRKRQNESDKIFYDDGLLSFSTVINAQYNIFPDNQNPYNQNPYNASNKHIELI